MSAMPTATPNNQTPLPAIIIRTQHLVKSYQMGSTLVTAVDDVNLTVQRNAFVVAMGPSGSGKSSLLYLLGGLDRPTKGEIEINGQQISKLNEDGLARYRQKTVGFIFQSFNLVPNLTALENVAYPLRFAGVDKKKRLARASELLKQVGLYDRAHHKPSELSGGQQQRVAVARALVNNPEIVFADEPTGNLDTQSGLAVMQLLAELHRSGRTVFVVTHDPRMEPYASQIIRMLDGKLVSI